MLCSFHLKRQTNSGRLQLTGVASIRVGCWKGRGSIILCLRRRKLCSIYVIYRLHKLSHNSRNTCALLYKHIPFFLSWRPAEESRVTNTRRFRTFLRMMYWFRSLSHGDTSSDIRVFQTPKTVDLTPSMQHRRYRRQFAQGIRASEPFNFSCFGTA